MYKRLSLVLSLAVLLVVALSFASTVGAQEEDTPEETTLMAADAENSQVEVKTDNVTVEREDGKVSAKTDNVSTSNETSGQQSSLTVQQNQADEGAGSQANTGDVTTDQNSSSSCRNPVRRATLNEEDADDSVTFTTEGEKFRVTYDVTFGSNAPTSREFRIAINRDGTEVDFDETNANVNDATFIVSEGSDTYDLTVTLSNAGTGTTFDVTVDDCRGSDDNNDNNRNNVNRNNDNNRNNRVIRINRNNDDDGGAARRQYGDTEVIVKTIPDKGRLADTGGSPLILLAGAALLSTGLLVGRSVFRRDP